jgi:hypothetical protein
MRSLLKAEFSYNSFVLLLLILFLTTILFAVAKLAGEHLRVDPSAFWLLVLLFIDRIKEKRTRFLHVLPLSEKILARARLAYQSLFWLAAIVIYVISFILYSPGGFQQETLWQVLTLSGILITANAAIAISIDVWTGFPGGAPGKKLLVIMMWLFIIIITGLLLYGHREDFSSPISLSGGYRAPIGAIFLHVIGIILSVWSYVLFRQRKSFLN